MSSVPALLRRLSSLIVLVALLPLQPLKAETGEMAGTPWQGGAGVTRTTAELMNDQALKEVAGGAPPKTMRRRGRFPHREHLKNAQGSPVAAAWSDSAGVLRASAPAVSPKSALPSVAPSSQPLNFTGATLPDCQSFPPDTMGAAGPSQFLVVLNGRIRVFDKTTAVVGSLDLDLDVFFQSVRGADYTTDPRVRYDRLSGRWMVICITGAASDNKVLLAVSNNGTITAATVWTYFSFVQSAVAPAGDKGSGLDYPTLGVDVNALYIGASVFDANGNFQGATAIVVRKTSVLGAGPIVVTAFRSLTGGDPYGVGPAVPQGVDNYDPAATVGYFIGTDNANFGSLILRRVSSPGGKPAISANIPITVPATAFPIPVPHKGNNDTTNGLLDFIDDRLMAAHLRNGSLWTSHQIGVDNTGVSDGATITRNGERWYQLANLGGTPTVPQSGTLFAANSSNVTTDLNYWMGTIMVSGQGHAALGCSSAGTNDYVNAVSARRLATDAPGTFGPPVAYTASSTAYNPPGDDGTPIGVRRWGDFSMTTVDPSDDMTMWTIQEFCSSTDNYGVQVLQIKAPPPATPVSCQPSNLIAGRSNVTVALTGTSTGGSGFFDPGPGFPNRIAASVNASGVTVNSVTYTDPTHISLNLSLASNATPGPADVIVTNPDGQSSRVTLLTISIPSTNANLSDLGVSAGTLSPAFDSATTSYTDAVHNTVNMFPDPVNIAYYDDTIRFTPTAADPTATITVNGTPVVSGSTTAAIHLNTGDNPITTVVTAQDGTTTMTYTVIVTRAFATSGSWNRPDANGNAAPVALSATATAVPYDVYHFKVDSTGTYNLSCTTFSPANWDTYLFLYAGDFAAQSPLTDGVIGNDNDPDIGVSGFSVTLQAGTDYFLVTTGFDNSSSGEYTLSIQGAGVVTQQAPSISVEYPAGTSLQDGSSSVDFSTLKTGVSNTLTFIVKSQGNINLSGLAVTLGGTNSADFNVVGPGSTTLSPGTGTTFAVTFTPVAPGARAATLYIASNDGEQNPFTISLTGTGTAKPVITTPPASLLVGTGDSATFTVTASGAGNMTYKWFKNSIAIAGATSTTFTIPSVALTDAASYSVTATNALGSATSAAARLVVVNQTAGAVTFNAGTTISLPVKPAAPAGTLLTYQWKGDNAPINDNGKSPGQVVSGATTATLSITRAATANAGSYTCVVGMAGQTKESGATAVSVRYKPIVNPLGPLSWNVGGQVSEQFTAQNAATTFAFSGLPTGVKSTTSGTLYGVPTTATTSTKTFTVTASNLAGSSLPVTVSYAIAPLPPAVVGTFNGSLDRDTTLTGPSATPPGLKLQGLGGSLSNFVVASTGACTGTLNLEDKSYLIPPGTSLSATPGSDPTGKVTLVRGTTKDTIADLTFSFSIGQNTGKLTGTVTDNQPGSTPIPVLAWRNLWSATANPAKALAGAYTAVLDLDPALQGYAAHPGIPQGRGYVTLAITTAGLATWGGRLADGTAVTGSTTLGPDGELPLHLMLYTPTVATTAGSIHGWAQASADSMTPLLNGGHPLLDGSVDWIKLAQVSTSTTRSYKAGFPLHNLTVKGGVYAAPPSGTPVLGISATGSGNDASLSFSEADLASSGLAGPGSPSGSPLGTLNQSLRISATNAVTIPAGSAASTGPNPGYVTIRLTASTGAVSGGFILRDNDPTDLTFPYTVVTRSVLWYGILVPRLGQGVGQFQMPQLPATTPARTTTTTSPILSGRVILQAGP